MVDFLKANPFISLEDYKWNLSVPIIRLMSCDNTRVHYLSDKEIEKRNLQDGSTVDLTTDLGSPIFM